MMPGDNPLIGIALMLGFCIVAPLGDAVAKLLAASVPLAQVVMIRFAIQFAMLLPLVALTGRKWRMRGMVLHLTLLRTVLHILGIALMFTALQYLPLADAVAIVFVMPFFMLLLGRYVLHEEVGAKRMMACIVGFAGTILVVQPSFTQVGWPAFLPVLVAANFSVFMLITRKIAKQTDPIGLQATSGFFAMIMLLPALVFGPSTSIPSLSVIQPDALEWGLLLAIGGLGTIAHLMMTWSLRYAPAATLTPMQYLEIPIATLIGLMVFGELPNALAAVGIVITMVTGLYIVLREGAIQRRQAVLAGAQHVE